MGAAAVGAGSFLVAKNMNVCIKELLDGRKKLVYPDKNRAVRKKMYCTNTYLKKCPYLEEEVEITVAVEAEMGFGCAIDWDRMEETCQRQEGCPHYQQNMCLLALEE